MLWLLIPLAFFIGSVPFGLLIGKMRGIDVRQHGSGNIGATNVFRILGKTSGIACLLLDFLKGLFPVMLACQLAPETPLGQTLEVATALAAILGHNYSPWLGFKGGKGIATTGGALAALMPVGVALLIVIFALVAFVTRYVSVASIVAAVSLPLLTLYGSWYHGKIAEGTWNKPLFIFSLIAGFLAVWKHRSNIARLRAGTENRMGSKKMNSDSPSNS